MFYPIPFFNLYDMTIQEIVDIVKEKLTSFHVTDTFNITDSIIINRINVIRELLIQQNKNKIQSMFYSEVCCIDVLCVEPGCEINGEFIESGINLSYSDLPELISGLGGKELKYLGLLGFGNNFSEVSFENLFESNYSRYSKRMIQYSRIGNRAYYLNMPKNVNKVCLVGLVKDPISLCSYYKEKTVYPTPQEYKLELLVVQDILSSYNVAPDEQNNTRHDLSAVRQPKQIQSDEQNKGQEN